MIHTVTLLKAKVKLDSVQAAALIFQVRVGIVPISVALHRSHALARKEPKLTVGLTTKVPFMAMYLRSLQTSSNTMDMDGISN